jgi:hypothetical protein
MGSGCPTTTRKLGKALKLTKRSNTPFDVRRESATERFAMLTSVRFLGDAAAVSRFSTAALIECASRLASIEGIVRVGDDADGAASTSQNAA